MEKPKIICVKCNKEFPVKNNASIIYIYCSDLNNLEMIKLHLRIILPKILIFYYTENEENHLLIINLGYLYK